MTTPIRWSILGPGNIAKPFARGLEALGDDAVLAAVGSRDAAKARAFANEFGAPRSHGSYEALAADTDVNAIYIATHHHANTLLCLDHGKAVLY